jgi:ribosome-associated protein
MTERISKSAQKRRFKDEESTAAELALLSDKDLKKLTVGQALKDEIVRCRGQKGGALKRQIKYLAKVMRDDSVDVIIDFLTERKGSKVKETKLHREIERLRDVLINEAINAQQKCLQEGMVWEPDWQGEEIDSFVQWYPVDEGDLRRTVFQYVKTRLHNHNREVFRIVKAAVDKREILRKMDTTTSE